MLHSCSSGSNTAYVSLTQINMRSAHYMYAGAVTKKLPQMLPALFLGVEERSVLVVELFIHDAGLLNSHAANKLGANASGSMHLMLAR